VLREFELMLAPAAIASDRHDMAMKEAINAAAMSSSPKTDPQSSKSFWSRAR
jgi:hypothetical protein